MTKRYLLRVTTLHLCAGAEFIRNRTGKLRCVRAAPVLKWMVGLPAETIAYRLEWMSAEWEWL